jgi:CRP/FNR family transcriptional regulator, cyclic AMP receptor protein
MNTESVPPELHTELQLLRLKIGAHPFFKGLRPEHLATLAIYAMQTDFAPGQMILKQGDLANRFYLILEGKVALETRKEDGTPVLVQTIGAGDVLGWSWLFDPYTWRFDARALEPGKAIFFYGTRLREHCEEDPRFGYELMERVAQVAIDRLQALRERLSELSRV